MRNGGGGAQIGKRRLMKHDGGFAANAPQVSYGASCPGGEMILIL